MNIKTKRQDILVEMARNLYKGEFDDISSNVSWLDVDDNEKTTDLCVSLKNGKTIAFEILVGNEAIDWVDRIIQKYNYSGFNYVWICTSGKYSLSLDEIEKLNNNKIGWRKMATERLTDATAVAMFNAIEANFDEMVVRGGDFDLEDKVRCLSIEDKEEIMSVRALGIRKFNELSSQISPNGEKGILKFKLLIIKNDNLSGLEIEIPFVIRTIFDMVENVETGNIFSQGVVFKSKYKSLILRQDGRLKVNFGAKRFFKEGVVLSSFDILRKNIYRLTKLIDLNIKTILPENKMFPKICKIYAY